MKPLSRYQLNAEKERGNDSLDSLEVSLPSLKCLKFRFDSNMPRRLPFLAKAKKFNALRIAAVKEEQIKTNHTFVGSI